MNARSNATTELALLGGPSAVSLPAPTWPVVGEQEAQWMDHVVRSGQWSWLGEHERAFCEAFRGFVGTRYCLAMANGTVTIQCALQAVGVEPGDEVIVPGLTWCATAQAAFDVGADVVFADIDPRTLCLDPAAFEAAVTPRTKAVIPVHLYGCMCDMDAIMDVARGRGVKVVEDVAHQHGSRWRDVGAGAIGDAGSFSFQQSKVLTCGEGGAVTCDDPDVYETAFALKQVGWRPADVSKDAYADLTPANRYGHNYRMTEMQAVLLRGGLSRIEKQTQRREEAAAAFAAGLERLGGPMRAVPRDPRVTRQAYYAMTLFFDPAEAGGATRSAYSRALSAEGCPVGGGYSPVYAAPLMNLYDRTSPVPYRPAERVQDYRDLKLPNTERAVNETALLLPHVHLLGDEAYIDQLLTAVAKVNDRLGEVQAAWEREQAAP